MIYFYLQQVVLLVFVIMGIEPDLPAHAAGYSSLWISWVVWHLTVPCRKLSNNNVQT